MGTIKEDIKSSSEWVAKALQSSGYRADFSPPSLWEIDRFFDEQTVNGAARPGGLLAKDMGARIFAIGSYIGEVLRRAKGGEWIGADSDPKAELSVELQFPDGSHCWPVQRAMKRFKNGEENGIAVYGHALGLEIGPRPKVTPSKPFPMWKKLIIYFLIGCVMLAIKLLVFGK